MVVKFLAVMLRAPEMQKGIKWAPPWRPIPALIAINPFIAPKYFMSKG